MRCSDQSYVGSWPTRRIRRTASVRLYARQPRCQKYGGHLRLQGWSSVRPNDRSAARQDRRKPRADAIRNRERVLEAAKAVFSAGGPEASLEAVARQAGVGIGTLYRHFPTREALFEAVYRREVEQLVELAEQSEGRAARSRRCAAGCAPMSSSSRPRRACRPRWRWPCTLVRPHGLFVRPAEQGVGDAAAARGRGRGDPRRYRRRRTSCGRSSACATCTTSRAGRATCCDWSTCSSMGCDEASALAPSKQTAHDTGSARSADRISEDEMPLKVAQYFNPPVSYSGFGRRVRRVVLPVCKPGRPAPAPMLRAL